MPPIYLYFNYFSDAPKSGEFHSHLSPEVWKQFVLDAHQHTLFELLQQDPLILRAFLKPRGYAGDAEMLDLVYVIEDAKALPVLEKTSALGKRLHHTTANLAAARAVRSRRRIISDQLNNLADRMAGAHVVRRSRQGCPHCSSFIATPLL